jgi:predicted nuclease of restriction endonuclease-like (RecB) superfamily
MKIEESDYKLLLEEIKEKIRKSRYEALKKVNKELINLYWQIGGSIVERQEKYGWGKSVVEQLGVDLQNEYPGIRGYSSSNLWRMRGFYKFYKDNEKLAPLVREISWSHNIVILEKCKDDIEREFYIKMSKKFGWTKAILIHQVEGNSYERFLVNQTNFEDTLVAKYKDQAKLAIKDEYSFDFLEMSEEYRERDLELGLVKDIQKFLIELGGDYAFIGNQYRLKVGTEDFFVDLLLFHRELQCLVAIELKATSFKPEYAGKLQFYLTALNEQVKKEHEQPSIGILICKEKDRTVVEYSLKTTSHPMGVASYRIEKEVPDDLKSYLPTPEEIIKRIEGFLGGSGE